MLVNGHRRARLTSLLVLLGGLAAYAFGPSPTTPWVPMLIAACILGATELHEWWTRTPEPNT